MPNDDWVMTGEVPDDDADPPLTPTEGSISGLTDEYLVNITVLEKNLNLVQFNH